MKHEYNEQLPNTDKNKHKIIKRLLIAGFIIITLFCFIRQKILLNSEYTSIAIVHIFICILILFIGWTIIIFIFKERCKIEKLFLLVVIPLGIIYTLLIPPGIVPDEWTHMSNSLSLSSQIMQKEDKNKKTLRETEKDLFSFEVTGPNNEYYNGIYTNIFKIASNNEYVTLEDDSTDFGLIFSYFPAVIGVSIGRILNFGSVTTAYVGRLFNFTFYVLITYLALKKMPFGKLLLFTVTMLPMTCHQMFSLSYDAVINAATFFCISYGMYFVYRSDDVKKKDILLYGLGAILLLTIKGSVYSFILVIPILAKYFNPNGYEMAKKNKIIIFVVILLVIVLLNLKTFLNIGSSTSSIEVVSGETLVPWSGTPSYTLSSLLTNIPLTIKLFLKTLIEKGLWYINTSIGSELGWFNILLPSWIISIWLSLLMISSIGEKSNNEVFTYEHKLLFFLIACGTIFLVMLAMALAWTPQGYQIIEGVQGRYFIPIIYLLLICLQNTKIFLKGKLYKIVLISIPVMSIVTIYNLINIVFLI